MAVKKPGFSVTEVTHEEKKQKVNNENKIRVLVVDNDTAVRQNLIPLINKESGLLVCAEAEDANEALEAIEKQQVDFAIVNISCGHTDNTRLTEKIKLQCPNLPILILSIHEEPLHTADNFQTQTEEYAVKHKTDEKIIAAIRYVQSLLNSQIFGFSVVVKGKE